MKHCKRILEFLLSVLTALTIFSCVSWAADDFEKSLEGFPESYRVKLRELHTQFPNWRFVPLMTGLDWDEAVTMEASDKRSLVSKATSDLLKSKAKGDYFPETDTYKQWDSGWVCANKLAVSYAMDPRNYLDMMNIFQFELLSFDESHTVDAIENVLYNSFMYDKKITYLNTKGEKKTLKMTYSEAIYEAGKAHNINPVYLASKILNEVGYSGSSSVTGKHSTYPGIYNFYNIGATDGAGAIGRGLKWAKSGTTYSRPWTDPRKSIIGGAGYIASGYINKGQDTGYLQKFQVNPKASHSLYYHQYMTNVFGAVEQGNTTYSSYLGGGLIAAERIFSIPVFENMPGEAMTAESLAFKDGDLRTAVVTASSCNVRQGPSTNYGKLSVGLSNAQKIKVNGIAVTDAMGLYSYLNYPYWYSITFTSGGKNFSGYIPVTFAQLSSKTYMSLGTHELKVDYLPVKSDDLAMLSSSNEAVARVNGNSIELLSKGKATITAATSTGGFDMVVISADSAEAEKRQIKNVSCFSPEAGTLQVQWNNAETYTGYQVTVYDQDLKKVKSLRTEDNTATVSGLEDGAKYNVCVRSFTNKSGVLTYGEYSDYVEAVAGDLSPTPPQVTELTATQAKDGSCVLKWKKLDRATGYRIYKYDSSKKKYVVLTSGSKNSYTLKNPPKGKSYYRVKAYTTLEGKTYYGTVSDKVTFVVLSAPAAPTLSALTKNTATIKWKAVSGASKYEVYSYSKTDKKYTKIGSTTGLTYTLKGLPTGFTVDCCVQATVKPEGKTYRSAYSPLLNLHYDTVLGLKATAAAGSVTLTWTANKSAEKYQVFRYVPEIKKYVSLAKTEGTSYSAFGLASKETHTYCVRILRTEKGKTVAGQYSEKVKVTAK